MCTSVQTFLQYYRFHSFFFKYTFNKTNEHKQSVMLHAAAKETSHSCTSWSFFDVAKSLITLSYLVSITQLQIYIRTLLTTSQFLVCDHLQNPEA